MAYIPLVVRESDGSPSAAGVAELIVSNASLTTGSGRSVTVVTGAGSTAGGTLTVAEADGSPSVGSVTKLVASSAFTVTDDSSGQVTLALGASSAGAAGGRTLLADTTTTGAVSDITLSGISSGYKALYLVAQLRGASTVTQDTLRLQFNGDTGANYDYNLLQHNDGNSAIVGVIGSTGSFIRAGTLTCDGAPTGSASVYTLTIPNYAGVTWQKELQAQSFDRFGTASLTREYVGGVWRSTAGITAIKLFAASGGNLMANSRVTLWGDA